jgi:uncharacterized membrane protein YfcA
MTEDILFYCLDGVIFVMFLNMLRHSKEVDVEVKPGMKWIVFAVFGVMAVISFLNFDGPFRWIQSCMLLLLGAMYYQMKSGLGVRGIIMMGSLRDYEKAQPVRISKNNSCLFYKRWRGEAVMLFDREQLEEIRSYLADNGVKIEEI